MKQEETSELLFTRLWQPQTLTALLCFVSHFARIAVEEKGPDRIIRQGWSFVANISTNPKFHGWMRHLSHTPCHNASGIASRFANFEKFERAKRWRRFRHIHETSNIQRPIPGHFSSFFHVFSTCLDAQFCEGLPGLGWDDQQSGQGLRDTLWYSWRCHFAETCDIKRVVAQTIPQT